MTAYQLPEPAMVHVDAQMYSTPCYTAAQMHEAYAAGQRDMREAAAAESLSTLGVVARIRELPIGEI